MNETIVWSHVRSNMPYIARYTTTLANGKNYLLALELSSSGAAVVGWFNQIEFVVHGPDVRPSALFTTIKWVAKKRVLKGVKECAQLADNQVRLREAYEPIFQQWAESVLAEILMGEV